MIAPAVDHAGLTVMFAHAHVLRILGARWCGLPPGNGAGFTLEPASVSVLAHEREVRVIEHWDPPLPRVRTVWRHFVTSKRRQEPG